MNAMMQASGLAVSIMPRDESPLKKQDGKLWLLCCMQGGSGEEGEEDGNRSVARCWIKEF